MASICWKNEKGPHYKDEDTFTHTSYDHLGNPLSTERYPFNLLSQGWNTWSLTEPLSAVVTIDDDRKITIKGSKAEWDKGVVPPKEYMDTYGFSASIIDREFQL